MFSKETEDKFNDYLLERAQLPNTKYIDAPKRARFRSYLDTASTIIPCRTKENASEFDFARRRFELGPDNQLYRSPEKMKCGQKKRNGKRTGLTGQPQMYKARYVVCIYEAFDIISEIHGRHGHNGKNKTWEMFEEHYYGVTRDDVCINFVYLSFLYFYIV